MRLPFKVVDICAGRVGEQSSLGNLEPRSGDYRDYRLSRQLRSSPRRRQGFMHGQDIVSPQQLQM